MQPPQQAVYEDNRREEVARHIPAGATSVLEVGCGKGGFGLALRDALGPQARIVGVEAMPEQAVMAAEGHGFDAVSTGYFPDALPEGEGPFDLVVFNDVLEHVLEPEDMLRDLHAHLAPRARVLAAIPSIQYAPVVWRLVRGRWDYADIGTLDRTHVRFFTAATMCEMFERAGYEVESCTGENSVGRFLPKLAKPFVRLLGNSQYVHFVIVARRRA
ncbi:class I SAM-dependent methyltransferase [Oryzobacter telluris]|uniref:class I SAM-dependent methyltransferase n=1 Tax=Oryzobacter telluris TaxID=3149179 RepID=UPI00370DC915